MCKHVFPVRKISRQVVSWKVYCVDDRGWRGTSCLCIFGRPYNLDGFDARDI